MTTFPRWGSFSSNRRASGETSRRGRIVFKRNEYESPYLPPGNWNSKLQIN
jgi:hypothetical protein